MTPIPNTSDITLELKNMSYEELSGSIKKWCDNTKKYNSFLLDNHYGGCNICGANPLVIEELFNKFELYTKQQEIKARLEEAYNAKTLNNELGDADFILHIDDRITELTNQLNESKQ